MPQYTVVLLDAVNSPPAAEHRIVVAGVAASLPAFLAQSVGEGVALDPAALGPVLEVPLLPSQAAADLLAKLTPYGDRFPSWR